MATDARLISGDLYRGPDFLGRCSGVVSVEGPAGYGTLSAGPTTAAARRLVGVPLTVYAVGAVLNVEAIDILCRGGRLCVRVDRATGPVESLDPAELEPVA